MLSKSILPVIPSELMVSGTSGGISVFLSRISNAGLSMVIAEITVGISVHSSVIDGTVSEKIWYDLIPSSKLD